MSTATVSVIVAAAAVATSAVFQFLAIRISRRNVVSQLRANAVEAQITDLRDTLAEYMSLTYYQDVEVRSVSLNLQKEYTARFYERADREDLLFNKLRLQLDRDSKDHRRLLEAVEYLFRTGNNREPWIKRRDKLVEIARDVFAEDTRRVIG
jgi:hypothetical protein